MADIIDNNNSNNSSVTSNSNGGERRFKKPSNRPALQIYRPPGNDFFIFDLYYLICFF